MLPKEYLADDASHRLFHLRDLFSVMVFKLAAMSFIAVAHVKLARIMQRILSYN
jgi:hypothetical protein